MTLALVAARALVLTQAVVYSRDICHSTNANNDVHGCPNVQVMGIEHSRLTFRIIEERTVELESAEVNISQHQLDDSSRKNEEILYYQILNTTTSGGYVCLN